MDKYRNADLRNRRSSRSLDCSGLVDQSSGHGWHTNNQQPSTNNTRMYFKYKNQEQKCLVQSQPECISILNLLQIVNDILYREYKTIYIHI